MYKSQKLKLEQFTIKIYIKIRQRKSSAAQKLQDKGMEELWKLLCIIAEWRRKKVSRICSQNRVEQYGYYYMYMCMYFMTRQQSRHL